MCAHCSATNQRVTAIKNVEVEQLRAAVGKLYKLVSLACRVSDDDLTLSEIRTDADEIARAALGLEQQNKT